MVIFLSRILKVLGRRTDRGSSTDRSAITSGTNFGMILRQGTHGNRRIQRVSGGVLAPIAHPRPKKHGNVECSKRGSCNVEQLLSPHSQKLSASGTDPSPVLRRNRKRVGKVGISRDQRDRDSRNAPSGLFSFLSL